MKRVSITLLLAVLTVFAALAALGCSGSPNKDQAPAPSAAQPAVAAPAAPPPAAAAPTPAAAPAAPEASPEANKLALDTLMRGHFRQATEAREALIRGDMAAARSAMQWLAEHDETSAIPKELQPFYGAMRASAKRFAQAGTLREAGVVLASTLTKCADCHRTAQRGPKFGTPPLPQGEDGKSHMRRHLWVAQRMWEGLVDGSETTFLEAARVLAAEPWNTEVLAIKGANEAVAQSLDKHVHELSAEAAHATGPEQRADVYGHFVATCATCHRLLGRGPAAVPLPAAEAQPATK